MASVESQQQLGFWRRRLTDCESTHMSRVPIHWLSHVRPRPNPLTKEMDDWMVMFRTTIGTTTLPFIISYSPCTWIFKIFNGQLDFDGDLAKMDPKWEIELGL